MLLHFYQLIELGSEELGRARLNGGVMYLGANEQFFFYKKFLSLAQRHRTRRTKP